MAQPYWLTHSPLRQHVGPRGAAKRAFACRADADEFAADLNTRPQASTRRPYESYKCETCHEWHVGRRSKNRGLSEPTVTAPTVRTPTPTAKSNTHREARRKLRRRLEAAGADPAEIAFQVQLLKERQGRA